MSTTKDGLCRLFLYVNLTIDTTTKKGYKDGN